MTIKVVTTRNNPAKFYAKACPRCRGDMYKGKDLDGEFISCYQCGYERTEVKPEAVMLVTPGDIEAFAAKDSLKETA